MASLDLASGTKETYLSWFKAFCWFVRSTSLDFDELTRDDVKSFKEYLVNEKKLKLATVSSYLASVRSFYAYSEDNGIENIAHRVKGVMDSRSFKKEPLTPPIRRGGCWRRLIAAPKRACATSRSLTSCCEQA